MGIRPRRSIRTFASTLSTQMTSLPVSAKQAPTTRPTYPVPTTAILIALVYSLTKPPPYHAADKRVNRLIGKELRRKRARRNLRDSIRRVSLVRILLDY